MKKGLSHTKALFIWILVSIVSSIFYSISIIDNISSLNALMANAIIAYLTFIPILSFATGIVTVVKYFVWKAMGYNGTPIIFFGIMIYEGNMNLIWDITFPFEVFISKSFLNNMSDRYDERLVKEKIIKVETIGVISEFISLIVLVISGVIMHSKTFISAGIIAISAYTIICFSEWISFHGPVITIRNIDAGKGIYYLIRQVAAYGCNYGDMINVFEEKETESNGDEHFAYISLTIWQHIFLIKCSHGIPEISEFATDMIEHRWFIGIFEHIGNLTSEKVNLLRLYICYRLISGDQSGIIKLLSQIELNAMGIFNTKLKEEFLIWKRLCYFSNAVDESKKSFFNPPDFIRWFDTYYAYATSVNYKMCLYLKQEEQYAKN